MRFDYIGEDGSRRVFETRSGRKILTYYDPPPTPIRDHDWHAVDDNYEPGCPIGYGATEDAAILDLLVQYE
jgi:hypothetical protein